MALVSPAPLETAHQLDRMGTTHIETLVQEHRAYIHRLCLSILNDTDEAEDITQETFVAALLALNQFRGDAHIRTWLSAIAINLCRDTLRKRKTRQTLHTVLKNLHLLNPSPQPEDTYLQNETHAQLWHAVNALDEKHRLPVILHYAHNLPATEIAQILGLSEGTVYSRLHYARKQLLGGLKTRPVLGPKKPAGGLP
ncbi:MAG: RNA polymerase sigma factor [Anaerolineales bacterium]|nr:RNA polymerase sigma factor [Anaerolineales bacterium]